MVVVAHRDLPSLLCQLPDDAGLLRDGAGGRAHRFGFRLQCTLPHSSPALLCILPALPSNVLCHCLCHCHSSGEVRRSHDYRERYHATLETRSHNHLRVCRILSCFSALGFRQYVVVVCVISACGAGGGEGGLDWHPESAASILSRTRSWHER
jgi:hypothetical protein